MFKRLAYICFCLLLLYLIPSPWTGEVRNLTSQAVAPLSSALVDQGTYITNFFRTVGQIPTLRQDKASLEAQVASLQQQLIEKESLGSENEALRKELGVTGVTRGLKKVFAHVIVLGSDPTDQVMTIDVGSDNGVKVGQPAIYQGALVGKVISARQNSAIVRTIFSKESYIQAWVMNTHEKGLLIGDGNQLLLSDITQGVPIASQSIVETSGLGGSLPQGLLIGQVSTLASQKNDLSQQFIVKPSQDLSNLSSLFILLVDNQ